ncbi:MAG TPA: family 1 encapsulin nanocompartment shell protein [Stellaceae bacterium]|jgi:uncharacterized linocin/CFP29 family protein
MDYLNRNLAPFPEPIWDAIDAEAVKAARDRLTGRRFLDIEGPFGTGLTTIEVGNDDYCRQPGPDEAGAILGRALPVPMLRKSFRLSMRRIAAHVENGQPLDLAPARDAAEAVADREEEFIYKGQPDFHMPGLLTVEGRKQIPGSDWSTPDGALKDVLAAATLLDESGYRGPFALALPPARYNSLFQLFPGSDVIGLEHLRRLCTAGIHKTAIEGGALIDTSVGVLVQGQDLRAGYIGHDGVHYQFYISESIVLRIDSPEAVCTIGVSGQGAQGTSRLP